MRRKIKNIINNSLIDSNNKIIDLLNSDKNFIISRLGLGQETSLTYKYIKDNIIEKNTYPLNNNAGIYFREKKELELYFNLYNECIKNTDSLACFVDTLHNIQDYFCDKYNINKIKSRILEPFYCILEDIIPWTLELKNKKVLIINSFVESFQKQQKNNFQIFKDKPIFDKDQEFIFYKSYNTSAGNHLHSSWVETFELMKKDISKIDFDIALLGCGGYGLPLCNFIKKELYKSAIYIGGGLQLLFGVKGKRWNSHPIIGKIIKDNGKFISPSGEEIIKNKEKIEGGCYW